MANSKWQIATAKTFCRQIEALAHLLILNGLVFIEEPEVGGETAKLTKPDFWN
jgi:hypothetical protein